jgi:integrase
MSIARFEDSTGRKDFRRFHRAQAIAFKKRLGEAINDRSGERLSKASVQAVLRDLKAFFEWLSREPGYRSKIQFSDADYFSLNEKDAAIARARREKQVPTVEQVERVLSTMATNTALERRDRAVIAFAAMTGARVNALTSFQLRHVDLAAGYIDQDARQVRTKFAKTFRTWFMPVVAGAQGIFSAWITELREEHFWGPADPLFPATAMKLGEDGGFEPEGLARHGWASTGPVRDVFRRGFAAAGLPYFNPHSFRDMLVRHAMTLNLSPEEMKAWSQNLGHEAVLTTFTSYGTVPSYRQGELISACGTSPSVSRVGNAEQVAALEAVLAAIKAGGSPSLA